MEELELVSRCLRRDNEAWKIFYKKYSPVIQARIYQIFKKYSYHPSDFDFEEAFNHVLDHFLLGKAFEGFVAEKALSLNPEARHLWDYRSI